MKAADRRARSGAGLLVAVLTAAALLLRVAGIDSMLPYQLEPDHGLVRTVAWLDRPADVTEPSPWAGPTPIYPWLMPRILQLVPGSAYPKALPPASPLEEHLASASRPFVRTRWLAALLSTLAVPFTYLLARRVRGRGVSLLAAALAAASVLLQNYGQQGRAHGPMGGLSVLGMVAIVAIPSAPSWRNYLLAGTATGVAMACLHTGGFLLPAFLVAHLLSRERWSLLKPLGALAVVAVFVALFYPSIHTLVPLKEESTFSVRVTEQLRTLRPLWEGLTGIPGCLWGTEPVLLVSAVLGGALAGARLLRRPRPSREAMGVFLPCAAFAASYFVFWVALFPFRPRYLTSIVPFLAVLGAYGAGEVGGLALRRVSPASVRSAAGVLLALALLALPAWTCGRLWWLRYRPDTAEQAAAWLAAHADREHDRVALGLLFDLPILERREDIETIPGGLRSHWQRYQVRLAADDPAQVWRVDPMTLRAFVEDKHVGEDEVRAFLQEHGSDWVVIADHGPEARAMDDSEAAVRALYGEPVASFPSRGPDEERGPYPAYDLGPDGLSAILRARTWGFPVEIYGRPRR